MASEGTSTIPAVQTVRVAISDILEGLENNGPDGTSYRTHVLKLSPPFDGEHEATLDAITESPGQTPDHSGGPAYIRPIYFVGYEVGGGPVNETDIEQPTKETARKIAHQKDFLTSLEDQIEHQYDILIDMWRERIKNELLDKVRIAHDPETGEEVWVDVEYQ